MVPLPATFAKDPSSEQPPTTISTARRRGGATIKEYPRQADICRHLCVTFEVDERDQIRSLTAEAAAPSTRAITRQDRHKLWWSRTELMCIWKREQSVCDFYRQNVDGTTGNDFATQVRRIFLQCSSSQPRRYTVDLIDAEVFATESSSNRGLEHRILYLLRFHRHRVIQGVLEHQKKVTHLSLPAQHHMIRSKSTYFSRSARVFAELVAVADALVVARLEREEKEQDHVMEQWSDDDSGPSSTKLGDNSSGGCSSFRGVSLRLSESFRLPNSFSRAA